MLHVKDEIYRLVMATVSGKIGQLSFVVLNSCNKAVCRQQEALHMECQ